MDEEGLAARSLGRIDPGRQGTPVVGVVVVKIVYMAAVFYAYSVSKTLPAAVFLFVLKASSAVGFVLLQKPFTSGKRLSRTTWVRVGRYSLLVLLTSLLWCVGLSLCGPLRTVLLSEHSDLALGSLLSILACTHTQGKGRGAVFFLLGVLCLLLFDNDHSAIPLEHPEGPHRGSVTHFMYRLLSFLGVPDHKGGIVVLLAGVCLSIVQRNSGRKLAVDVGGSKRLQALSATISASLLLPWVVVQLVTQSEPLPSLHSLSFLFLLGLAQLADFYASTIASQRVDHSKISRIGSVLSFSVALAIASLSSYWQHYDNDVIGREGEGEEHGLSVGVVMATVFFLVATATLTHPTPRSSSYSLVGYSSAGLPLYSTQRSLRFSSLLSVVRDSLRKIMDDGNSRRIFYFLLLNLGFTVVEMLYGVWTNSLGLISDGFHMLFDCSALVVGLCAALVVRWKPTRLYSFGYGRVEVLSGFVNSLFLVSIATAVLSEALTRLLDPPTINTDKLLVVSVAGFLVNLVGIATFSTNSHGHSHGSHGHSHNTNMQGVFLHILADTLGSVGVIISSLLVQTFGWHVVDPICSVFIAVLIILSVVPLLRQSAEILVLATPNYEQLYPILDKLPLMDGVVSWSDAHFWQQGCSSVAGTIHVQVAPSANDQKIITMVTNYLRERGGVATLTVQVEKERFQLSGAAVSYIHQSFPSTPPEVYVNYGPQTGEVKAV